MRRGKAAHLVGALVAAVICSALPWRRAAAFVTFETGQVRPLALTPNGKVLLAVNTPDDRLEVFAIDGGDAAPGRAHAVGRRRAARHRLRRTDGCERQLHPRLRHYGAPRTEPARFRAARSHHTWHAARAGLRLRRHQSRR